MLEEYDFSFTFSHNLHKNECFQIMMHPKNDPINPNIMAIINVIKQTFDAMKIMISFKL